MLGRLDDPAALPDEPLITALTLAELSVGPLVAAMALAHVLPAYTCNPDDVAGIDGPEVVAVPVPTR